MTLATCTPVHVEPRSSLLKRKAELVDENDDEIVEDHGASYDAGMGGDS